MFSQPLFIHRLKHFGLQFDPHDKPRVGVSACLLGHAVRYDGDHKVTPGLQECLAPWLTLEPLCPEVGIGMPVPRPPIQVVSVNNERRVRGVQYSGMDVTDELTHFARQQTKPLHGLVLKARSPSCGVGTTPVYDHHGEDTGTVSDGQFALVSRQLAPHRPMFDESLVDDDVAWQGFVLCTFLYRHLGEEQADRGQIESTLATNGPQHDGVFTLVDQWLTEWLASCAPDPL